MYMELLATSGPRQKIWIVRQQLTYNDVAETYTITDNNKPNFFL